MRLAALHLHPVKSARGILVDRAEAGPTGLRHDRRWMVVDADGRFVSQREDPRLGRIVPSIADDALVLAAPGLPELRLPLAPPSGDPLRATIWDDVVDASGCGDEADAWLERLLGAGYRLAYLPDATIRPVDPAFARPGDRVSLADGYPYLLTSRASLDDLNRRAGTRLTMERFRPNLVIEGAAPYAEDGWHRIAVGGVAFRVAKPCARCVVTTLDPDTQEAGAEPLRTLASFRKRDGKVFFGQNLLPDDSGVLRVGDAVDVWPAAPDRDPPANRR